MTVLRAGPALLLAALLLGGCGSGGAGPTARTGPVSVATTPGARTAAFTPLTPARTPTALTRRLVAAERVIHRRDAPAPLLQGAAFEAQLRYRQLARTPGWIPRVVAALPRRYRAEARLQVDARHSLRSVLTTVSDQVPAWRIRRPAPLARLVAAYRQGQRRYGVPWQVLAAVNLVETTFGKVDGLSTAGAQGPMQFMPATWASYGTGDVRDPHAAILGAARYLAASGGAEGTAGVRQALLAYNDAVGYVDGIEDYRRIITEDPAWLGAFYRWQVVYVSTAGDLWLPEGYLRRSPEPASSYAARYPRRHLVTTTR
ncbi:MAG: transglycosylase SLT domain-containing protein [Nocardioidaceae bacterium]|nr:transglycosylase SLT domain-containing protein [Nocardioidaceae bacterium]MCL2614020.1 transglycosylase SLT domain-containing protein [Nocardioidaceae bacterium]